jgi:Sporulation delaying protein SdpA
MAPEVRARVSVIRLRAPRRHGLGTRTRGRTTSAQGFYFTACALLVLFTASIIQYLPVHVLPVFLQPERTAVATVWPQKWDFFAAQPTTDVDIAYRIGDGGVLDVLNQPQMAAATDWGLSQSGLAQFVELDDLVDGMSAADWHDCGSLTPSGCQAEVLRGPVLSLANRAGDPTVCGHVLLELESPERWTDDTRLWMSEWKIVRAVDAEVVCAH